MGVLYKDSWHSKHAGQTVDDAIDGYRQIQDTINEIYGDISALKLALDECNASLKGKYDKTGGPITIGKSTDAVNIIGRGSMDLSMLKVRHIEGATASDNSTRNGPLYLNRYSTGKIYLGKGGAFIDEKGKVYGAVWNDFAEYRESEITEPGRVICENGDGTLSLSYKRLQPGAAVISDTFGFAIGETDKAKTPIAVAGRVLAHTYEDWWTFEPGEAVCTGPNGTVSKMSRREIRKYPERIIGTVSELPTYETWGDNKIPVDGRIWINIK
jgi:hypothetical protein